MSDYRSLCLFAYGKKCDVCGSSKNVVAHHIKGRFNGDHLSNLVPLCGSCHGKVHHGNPSENVKIAHYQSALPNHQRIPRDMVFDTQSSTWYYKGEAVDKPEKYTVSTVGQF